MSLFGKLEDESLINPQQRRTNRATYWCVWCPTMLIWPTANVTFKDFQRLPKHDCIFIKWCYWHYRQQCTQSASCLTSAVDLLWCIQMLKCINCHNVHSVLFFQHNLFAHWICASVLFTQQCWDLVGAETVWNQHYLYVITSRVVGHFASNWKKKQKEIYIVWRLIVASFAT